MQTTPTTTSTNKLHKITLIYSLMDEFPEEVSLHTANVYSYMLCKYNWFNSKKQDYFETQETIAEGCRVSLSAVKTAVRFLLQRPWLGGLSDHCPGNQHPKTYKVRIAPGNKRSKGKRSEGYKNVSFQR